MRAQFSDRRVHAHELERAPTIDGVVLDDAVWGEVQPSSGFRQLRPDEGAPASQTTDVYIGYTDEALYIGVVAYDEDPAAIIVADGRRDARLDDMDSFKIILDTFHDRQNGFVFGTNAGGIAYDGQVSREADFASGGRFNLNWDTSWTVRSRITEIGWSAEFEIPWRSLRYGSGAKQVWGINFQRNIGRNNETAYWALVPRQYNLYRTSRAGTVTELRIPPQRNLKVTPYVLTAASRNGAPPQGTDVEREFGFDVKYSLTPGLTVDATYNTDFAQVEVDEQQLKLDRFSIFLPEKRPFFLENAGIFSVGNPHDVELFFSRRIGIAPDGTKIPIDGGLRLSGRIGKSTSIGLLKMRTAAVDGVAPANDYAVARLRQDLPGHSSLGALFVNRAADGSHFANGTNDVDRTYAIDGSWGITDNLVLDGWAARTDTPGLSANDTAHAVRSTYSSLRWLARVDYTEVGENFNPEAGFLRADDYRRIGAHLLRRFHPRNSIGLYEIRPQVAFTGYWDFDGFYENGLQRYDVQAEWLSGLQFRVGLHELHEGILEPFDIVKGVTIQPGTYDDREFEFRVVTRPSAPFSANVAMRVGSFYGGKRLRVTPNLKHKFGDTFSTELAIDYNDINLPVPNGDFDLALTQLRLSYSFAPKIFLQALMQYNNTADSLAVNLRFSWLQSANAGLYVVYNEVRENGLGSTPPGRELIVKYSRIFDIFD